MLYYGTGLLVVVLLFIYGKKYSAKNMFNMIWRTLCLMIGTLSLCFLVSFLSVMGSVPRDQSIKAVAALTFLFIAFYALSFVPRKIPRRRRGSLKGVEYEYKALLNKKYKDVLNVKGVRVYILTVVSSLLLVSTIVMYARDISVMDDKYPNAHCIFDEYPPLQTAVIKALPYSERELFYVEAEVYGTMVGSLKNIDIENTDAEELEAADAENKKAKDDYIENLPDYNKRLNQYLFAWFIVLGASSFSLARVAVCAEYNKRRRKQ